MTASYCKSDLQIGTQIEVTIEKMVFGGEGLARYLGRAVFIASVLPDEKVLIEVIQVKKDYARGKLLQVLSPSPNRITPLCPHFQNCGGCDWMHIEYSSQLNHKKSLISESFEKLYGQASPRLEVYPSKPFGYRNRAQWVKGKQGFPAYLKRNSNETLEPQKCPILTPALSDLLSQKIDFKTKIWMYDSGVGLLSSPALKGISKIEGTTQVYEKLFYLGAESFFQSNFSLLEPFIDFILANHSGKRAMDLYAGIGLFSKFLQEKFDQILWIEENPDSLKWAKNNLDSKKLYYFNGSAENWVKKTYQNNPQTWYCDLIIADPPRGGLSDSVKDTLIELAPSTLILVSCNPPTLMRDLKFFKTHNYLPTSTALFDFYPQTSHMEVVVKLQKP